MFDYSTLTAFAAGVLALAGITFVLSVVAIATLVRDHRRSVTPRVVTVTREPQVELQRAA